MFGKILFNKGNKGKMIGKEWTVQMIGKEWTVQMTGKEWTVQNNARPT